MPGHAINTWRACHLDALVIAAYSPRCRHVVATSATLSHVGGYATCRVKFDLVKVKVNVPEVGVQYYPHLWKLETRERFTLLGPADPYPV